MKLPPIQSGEPVAVCEHLAGKVLNVTNQDLVLTGFDGAVMKNQCTGKQRKISWLLSCKPCGARVKTGNIETKNMAVIDGSVVEREFARGFALGAKVTSVEHFPTGEN